MNTNKMKFSEWLEEYVRPLNDGSDIIKGLKSLPERFYIKNTEKDNIGKAVHIYFENSNIVLLHLIIHKNYLAIGKSKAPTKMSDTCSRLIPMYFAKLYGLSEDLQDNSSRVNVTEINKDNVSYLWELLYEVFSFYIAN